MPSVTASDFINVMSITDSATNMEYVLDLAIDTKTVNVAENLTFAMTDTSEMSTRLGEIKSEIKEKLKALLAEFQ